MNRNGDARARALAAMREDRWGEAVKILETAARERDDPWIINDLAMATHQAGDLEAGVALLDQLPANDNNLPAAVRLNRYYLTRARDLWAGFDPCWKRERGDDESRENAPKVSVIVRTYQRPDLLEEALRSLKVQSFSDFETIVVNDGGDPASEDVVRESGLARARYFMLPHGGRVRALNEGLGQARGQYVTGLDDDDVVYPHHLETLAGFLDDAADVSVVYADYNVARYEKTAEGSFRRAGLRAVRAEAYRQGILFKTNPCTIMLMARRSCFEEAGKFMEALELAEDWEMWLRLAERFPFHHLPVVTAEVRERPGDANLTSRRLRQKYYWDNLVLYLHRGLFLLSGPKRPELTGSYHKALALLDEFLRRRPEAFPLLNLRGLWDMKKPYSWFADQGRWFRQLGEAGLAQECYQMGARLAPWQPKTWVGVARSGLAARKRHE
jgi:glycosyltransferase involved in cell wall biosynthesis